MWECMPLIESLTHKPIHFYQLITQLTIINAKYTLMIVIYEEQSTFRCNAHSHISSQAYQGNGTLTCCLTCTQQDHP
jgi:hypothetical protein